VVGLAVPFTRTTLVLKKPLPVTVSVMAAEPAGTDIGATDVISGVCAGGGVLPPLEPEGLELPQPETNTAIIRHTTAERKEDEQDFMVGSSIPSKDSLATGFSKKGAQAFALLCTTHEPFAAAHAPNTKAHTFGSRLTKTFPPYI
jgi:hypothetical protein